MGKREKGRTVRAVVHHLLGDPSGGRGCGGLTGSEVPGVDRVGAARDLHPHAVACRESVPGRPQGDPCKKGAVVFTSYRFRAEALQAVAHVDRAPVWPHVAEPDEEVHVVEVGAHPQLGLDGSHRCERLIQRI